MEFNLTMCVFSFQNSVLFWGLQYVKILFCRVYQEEQF